jgi:hypothetical protein
VKSITLVSLTSVDTVEHSIALQRSYDLLSKVRPVADMVMLCPNGSSVSESYTGRLVPLPFRCDILSYGFIQVRRMGKFIHTDYALNIQADGFAVNPEKWTEDFLEYDYCGAPWPPGLTYGSRVGNSGFCLRSRRFMEASALGPAYECEGDDVYWAGSAYEYFLGKGMKYAPLELAAQFSIENDIPELPNRTVDDCFGQHARMRLKVSE